MVRCLAFVIPSALDNMLRLAWGMPDYQPLPWQDRITGLLLGVLLLPEVASGSA